MVEENLRTGLIKSEGNIIPFFTRPICVVLWLLLVLAFFAPPALSRLRRRFGKAPA
jgi:TctA family transporter